MSFRGLICTMLIVGAVTAPALAGISFDRTIQVSDRTQMVYDQGRGLLYVTTSTGQVHRYDPAQGAFLSPWSVGVNIHGADITPDGHYLLAAERAPGAIQGMIRRVDLATGGVTNLTYDLFGDGGAFKIVTLNDGRAMFTSDYPGSGAAPRLRVVDLSSWSISALEINGQMQTMNQRSPLFRSHDGSMALMADGNTSGGGLRIYSTALQGYTVDTRLWTHLNGFSAAFSPDGGVVSLKGFNISFSINRSSDLSLIEVLAKGTGGLAWDPRGVYLYALSGDSTSVVAYNTSTYQPAFSVALPTGPQPGQGDPMAVSDDGRWLFVGSGGNIHVYSLPELTPGDANLDGVVNIADLSILAGNWQQPANWLGGDFNGDGIVNIADLSILAGNWQASVNGMGFAEALGMFDGFGGVVVPEPAGVGVLVVAGVFLRRRRWFSGR